MYLMPGRMLQTPRRPTGRSPLNPFPGKSALPKRRESTDIWRPTTARNPRPTSFRRPEGLPDGCLSSGCCRFSNSHPWLQGAVLTGSLIVGSARDHRSLSVFLDAYFFPRQRRGYGHPAGDVLRQRLSGLGGSGGDVHRSVDTESRVPPYQLIKLVAILNWIILLKNRHSAVTANRALSAVYKVSFTDAQDFFSRPRGV
jgi:hypothetical protein